MQIPVQYDDLNAVLKVVQAQADSFVDLQQNLQNRIIRQAEREKRYLAIIENLSGQTL